MFAYGDSTCSNPSGWCVSGLDYSKGKDCKTYENLLTEIKKCYWRQENVDPIRKKVFSLVYNPIIESQGKTLVQVMGWNNPDDLNNQIINDLEVASGGWVVYEVTKTFEVDDIPVLKDGYDYTDDSYLLCLQDHSTCHKPEGVNYHKILEDFNICTLLDNNEIDELWVWGGPWFGFWEAAMAGENPFWINGGPIIGTACKRNIPIMGYNYERGIAEALESYGHRFEATITHVFGGWDTGANRHDWDLFGHNLGQTNVDYFQCGSIHYAPNSLTDYQWDSKEYVLSNCDAWYDYPNLVENPKQMNCDEWNCDAAQHKRWWYNHIPKGEGSTNGILNNWWYYVADPNI
jgi:hypothetical protein